MVRETSEPQWFVACGELWISRFWACVVSVHERFMNQRSDSHLDSLASLPNPQMAVDDALPPCQLLVIDEASEKAVTVKLDFADTESFWKNLVPPGKIGTLHVPTLLEVENRAYGLCDEMKLARLSGQINTLAVDIVPSLRRTSVSVACATPHL